MQTLNARRNTFLAAGLIALAAAAAYSNSLNVPFLFDDLPCTVDNASIRHLWPLGPVLLPPGHYAAVQRRPVVNLSLAINYAISGEKVWSYHALNLAAHVLAALLLFGIVRRTLLLPSSGSRFAQAATPLAAAIALLWAVHPLLTDAVTYVIQRTEVLAGLFYLLTLYCTIRGAAAVQPRRWYAAAIAACALAMGSKEAAISAPVIVLLYDRVFLSASWRDVFRRRGGLYAGLAMSWLVVLAFVPYGAEGTKVLGEEGTMFDYALAQPGVIAHYLGLCFWPHPLVFDYGMATPLTAAQVIPPLLLIWGLFAASLVAFRYQPWLGFLGAWFFAILAPSSSVVPLLQQIAAEKRMYLPLAAVLTVVVVGGFLAGQWLVRRGTVSVSVMRVADGSLVLLAAVALAAITFCRNMDYRSELSIWQDTVAKVPNSARAHDNLGAALAKCGQYDAALAHYRRAMELMPEHAMAYCNTGTILASRGQTKQAIACYEKALKLTPSYESAHNNLGNVLLGLGRIDKAIAHYHAALELGPENASTCNNLGSALACRGQIDEAVVFFRRAVDLKPTFADAHNNLGRALASQGRTEEAVSHFQEAVRITPQDADARENLRRALAQQR